MDLKFPEYMEAIIFLNTRTDEELLCQCMVLKLLVPAY